MWSLASPSLHLLILLLCFALVYCGWWPSSHHRRVDKLSLGARMKIKLVVEENWDELLKRTKDLIDATLEDGEKIVTKSFWTKMLTLSSKTTIFFINHQIPQVGLTSP